MRGSRRDSVLAAALALLAGCVPPEPTSDPLSVRDTAVAGELRLNEAKALGSDDVPQVGFEGQVELINSGETAVRLGTFTLATDEVHWRLPDVTLAPGDRFAARSLAAVGAADSAFLGSSVRALAILDAQGRRIDEFDVPAAVAGGILARYPEGAGRPYVYPLEAASFGTANPDLGSIRKLAAGTEFKPRDSSPNAIVTYDGYHWILGGWSNFGGDVWHSYADVWQSKDAVRWQRVNDAPPYVHYSSFVVWQERMWAIGPSSFSSTDGIEWRAETIQAPALNRSVVFGDSLVNIHGGHVQATQDGVHWDTLTATAPWGNERRQPVVIVYRGKIWVMGGVDHYGEPGQVIFNDVWVSDDGAIWTLVTPYADWTPRLWASGVVHDDRIFLINGANATEWPDEYGNTTEIWFTDDGHEWLSLAPEHSWSARHASLTTVDADGAVLLLAGYGHGGLSRMHNDAWQMRVTLFFPKAQGDLRSLSTWGARIDGSGESPASFDAPNQLFVLRNRPSFVLDDSWAVTGAGSRIAVGDGRRVLPIEVDIDNRVQPKQTLQLLANSTTRISGCAPTLRFRDPRAGLIDSSAPCTTLSVASAPDRAAQY
jgi:hypothetical protein